MSIVNRINSQAIHLGQSAKSGAQSLFLVGCKVLTGAVLGLTLALVAQEIFRFGPILFWFILLTSTSTFYKVSKEWGGAGLLIFDLLCILGALLIRMYIVIAPG